MTNFGSELPKLPVPKLNDTLCKYVRSLKPIIDKKNLLKTLKLIKEFETSELAKQLQDYLQKRATEKVNWLNDWFIDMRYLNNPLPTALCTSTAHMLPFENFENEDARLSYTVRLIRAVASYIGLIYTNELPKDRKNGIAQDMSQYYNMFGTCRIPLQHGDKQMWSPSARHIIVAYNNQYFKLQLFDESWSIDEDHIRSELKYIVSQPIQQEIPIGILTTQARRTWGLIYEELHKDNSSPINDIESCLFLLCLDAKIKHYDVHLNRMTKAGMHLLHGGGSKHNGGNRWYDKTLQFIIGTNGVVGLIFEHSFCDGKPIGNMVEYLVEFIRHQQSDVSSGFLCKARLSKLQFYITDSMLSHIREAESCFNKSVDDSDIEWFKFKLFGKDFIKSVRLSPDSFIQIALQLAFYRLHGAPALIYEAVATKKYALGRLESLRSFSEESVAFAKIAFDLTKTNSEKLTALRLAVSTHKKYALEAGEGYGTERHFIGLKAAANELDVEDPSIFDGTYRRSVLNRLTTSQIATSCDSLAGFCTVSTDLYACCYNIRLSDINFSIFSFRSNFFTTSEGLKNALVASLSNMQTILLLEDE